MDKSTVTVERRILKKLNLLKIQWGWKTIDQVIDKILKQRGAKK